MSVPGASSIEDSPTFGHTELDLYGGWTGEVASGISVDAGLLYYVYPNGEGGAADQAIISNPMPPSQARWVRRR